MTTRRAKGEGSVSPRQDGRWSWGIKYPGAKRIGGTERTREAAEEALAVATETGKRRERKQRSQTLSDLLDDWMSDFIVPRRSEATIKAYRNASEKHLKPRLGDRRVRSLTRADVQRLIADLNAANYAPKTISFILTTLQSALRAAEEWGRVSSNVASRPRISSKPLIEINPFEEDEAKRFALSVVGHPRECAFLVALTMGLRRGEVLGLKRSDFNEKAKTLRVRGTKTASSDRTLPVPPSLVAKLANLAASSEGDDERFFPIEPRAFDREFKVALRDAGSRDIRFHDLRHTYATLALKRGVLIHTVAKMMGHSGVSELLETYAHALASQERGASEAMDDLIG